MEIRNIQKAEISRLLGLSEGHFADLKGKRITPAKFTRTVSAFANASGGEIFIGIEEVEGTDGQSREWSGFDSIEEANPFFQVLHNLDPLSNSVSWQFLKADRLPGLVLHINILKTQTIVFAADEKVYLRKNAQNLPVVGTALERLAYDKGVQTYEDHLLNVDAEAITNSDTIFDFLSDVIPTGEPRPWLEKQYLLIKDRPTVAGVLLYADEPQAILSKRSAVKIIRYQTKGEAGRDYLAAQPETMEGPIYRLVYDTVDRVKRIIESIEKVGAKGAEHVFYPEEALHELLTNAILHRDYSVAADIQVRIFDNRVEIESPGRLPGHVTVKNIAKTQFARNPKIIRLINKFKNPPNKDVGEGISTALDAMSKLRLKRPIFEEREGSVLVVLKHEALPSTERFVMDYLQDHPEITNQIAREISGVTSESAIKNVFYKLRDKGQIEQAPKVAGKKPAWRLVDR